VTERSREVSLDEDVNLLGMTFCKKEGFKSIEIFQVTVILITIIACIPSFR